MDMLFSNRLHGENVLTNYTPKYIKRKKPHYKKYRVHERGNVQKKIKIDTYVTQ